MFLSTYSDNLKNIKKEEKEEMKLPLSISYWANMLFEKAVRIFEWSDNLPFPQKEIEMRLLLYGYCGYVNDEYVGEMVSCGGMSIPTQYWDEFKTFTYAAATTKGGTKTIGKDCVIINNTALRNPLYPMIKRYANLLAHTDVSLKMSLVNLRIKNIISTDSQSTADSYRAMFDKFYNGDIDAILDDGLLKKGNGGIDNLALTSSGTLGVMDCIDARNELLRMFYNEIGVRYNRDKKERMIESEVENDEQMLLLNINDMLKQRQNACKEINRIFGRNISVKLSPEFKIIERKEVDNNANN